MFIYNDILLVYDTKNIERETHSIEIRYVSHDNQDKQVLTRVYFPFKYNVSLHKICLICIISITLQLLDCIFINILWVE